MNRLAFVRNLLISFLVILSTASLASPQTGTTSLRGVVTDKSGSAIVGATVTLLSQEQGQVRSVQSQSGGEYEFLLLAPGKYTLSAESDGFRKFERHNIDLLISSPATVNITLEVGISTQTIEVSAQAVTLNTTDASLGIAFNENQVKELEGAK